MTITNHRLLPSAGCSSMRRSEDGIRGIGIRESLVGRTASLGYGSCRLGWWSLRDPSRLGGSRDRGILGWNVGGNVFHTRRRSSLERSKIRFWYYCNSSRIDHLFHTSRDTTVNNNQYRSHTVVLVIRGFVTGCVVSTSEAAGSRLERVGGLVSAFMFIDFRS